MAAAAAAATGDHLVQVQQQPAPPTTGDDSSPVEGGVNLINDDQTVPMKTGPPTGRTPSIIKIDDGKSTAATGTATGQQPDPVPHKQRNSITREIIENDSNKAGENVPNKDLVTIVTISGSLEQQQQQQQHLNKSVRGGSAGEVATPATKPGGGKGSKNGKASSAAGHHL